MKRQIKQTWWHYNEWVWRLKQIRGNLADFWQIFQLLHLKTTFHYETFFFTFKLQLWTFTRTSLTSRNEKQTSLLQISSCTPDFPLTSFRQTLFTSTRPSSTFCLGRTLFPGLKMSWTVSKIKDNEPWAFNEVVVFWQFDTYRWSDWWCAPSQASCLPVWPGRRWWAADGWQ